MGGRACLDRERKNRGGGGGVGGRYQGEGYPSGRADGRPGKVGERKYSLIPKGLENIKVKIFFIIINCY